MTTELPKPGHQIGRYAIEKLLGEGGMGAVFAATNQITGRAVALKWMLPAMARSDAHVARFLAEARATARIEHPNVIQIIDVGQDGPAPFLVMERLRGQSLGERLREAGRLSVAETLRVMTPACRGIAEAHVEGIIHRDLKPDNIFLCQGKDGSPRPPKVLDFGISKLYDEGSGSKLTQTGAIMGTPLYMSPEQISAQLDPDPAFDIYAIGVVLYECLAGHPPFDADNLFGLLQRIGAGNATPLRGLFPDIPERVSNVVMRAMHSQRELRHASMQDLITDLERLQQMGMGEGAGPQPVPAPWGGPPAGPMGNDPGIPLTGQRPVHSVPATRGEGGVGQAGYPSHPGGATPVSQAYGSHPSGPGNAMPSPVQPGQSRALVYVLLAALAMVLLGVAGVVAYLALRDPAPPVAIVGQTPTGPPLQAPGDASQPEVGLRFGGSCAPSFAGRVMVLPSQGTVTLSATQGSRLAGHLTLGLPASGAPPASVTLSTRGRVDAPETIVHVMHDQTMWMNMASDPAGVLTQGVADPIRGRIDVRTFDGQRALVDVTFTGVILQESQSGSLCTIDGTVRTHGSTIAY